MHRIEVNLETGERTIIPYTPEEEAASLAEQARCAAMPPIKPITEARIAQMEADHVAFAATLKALNDRLAVLEAAAHRHV